MARKSYFCIATSRIQADETSTKAPECALAGAGTGGIIGGTMGWIAGIGALAIPGVGLFIAVGPIIAALSGVAIGVTIGGIAGAFIGQKIPVIDAKSFESKIQPGTTLNSQPHAPQAQSVADDRYGTQAHRGTGEDRAEQQA